MFHSEKEIHLQETEIKPNRAAVVVMIFTFCVAAFLWFLTEKDVFRVEKVVMFRVIGISTEQVRTEMELNVINRDNDLREETRGMVCSMACGYAAGDLSHMDELVARADRYMYENKALAKDCTRAPR